MEAAKESILIVDDDDSWAEFCKLALEAEGFGADIALSGGEALRKIGERAYDIVLTDLTMPPPYDGRAVVLGVKSRRPEADVILMTATPSLDTAISILRDGAYDYILKPFKPDYLMAVIGRCSAMRRSRKDLVVEKQLREEIQAAYADLKKFEKLKEAFLARLSHELNTPLTAADMALTLLQRDIPEEPKPRGRVKAARDSIAKLKEIFDDLLDFVDLQKSDLDMKIEPVDVAALFAQIAEETRRLLDAKAIKLKLEFPEAMPKAAGDLRLLKRAFRQLFLNAIHFNAQGGEIAVSGQGWENLVIVHVRDQGEGIPAGERTNVFDSFYQLADYMTRRVGGLGLGLAIVKKILECHHGSISVENNPGGKGSNFRVSLPQSQPEKS